MVIDRSFWRGKRVLVTGHTGFKGSWLSFWLVQLGSHVFGYALDPETNPSLFRQLDLEREIDHMIADIRDTATLESRVASVRPDVIFHMAAQPLVRRSYAEPLLTWQTNVMGTVHLLEALRRFDQSCALVVVTTDKVYENRETAGAYREADRLGGYDPYSSSKAACELAVDSWRRSFLPPHTALRIATARAGNVIGGGDWAADRILPDAMRAWLAGRQLIVRRPGAVRPWQHVLEPLAGYLRLAERLGRDPSLASAFNFGPPPESAETVRHVVELASLALGQGDTRFDNTGEGPHEARQLTLDASKAARLLGCTPHFDLNSSISRTVNWYVQEQRGERAAVLCSADIAAWEAAA